MLPPRRERNGARRGGGSLDVLHSCGKGPCYVNYSCFFPCRERAISGRPREAERPAPI